MKRFAPLLALFAALVAGGCARAPKFVADDFAVPLYTPAHASGFAIRGAEGSDAVLVAIRNPWQGATDVEQHLLLLPEEAPVPTGFDGTVIRTPVRRVICMSSSHVAMFDALDEIGRVRGVSGIDYISNDYVRAHRACGEVRDVGPDTHMNFELLAALRPDVVLLYGVTGENSVATAKLRELQIPYVYVGDYVEQSPLGKAEWTVLCAELCGCREKGCATFERIAERYDAVRRRIETYVAEHAPDRTCRPKALLNAPYRDTWFMPSADNYMVRLIRDAGGDTFTVSEEGSASLPVDLEQAYLLAADADVWLNPGMYDTLAEFLARNPKFSDMPVVREGRVWNNNLRRTPAGGSDFWESGVVRPDVVLSDLFAILYPRSGFAHLPVYYHALR